MSKRRPVRINVELPELTPAQADFLWNFLDDLAAALWDAYEIDIFELQNTFSCEASDEPTVDQYDADLEKTSALPNLVDDSKPDPDF